MTDIYIKCDSTDDLKWKAAGGSRTALVAVGSGDTPPTIREVSSGTVTFYFKKDDNSNHNVDYSPDGQNGNAQELSHAHGVTGPSLSAGRSQVYFRRHGSDNNPWYTGYVEVSDELVDP